MKEISTFRQCFSLFLLMLAYALSFIDRQILSLLVEPVKQDLNISDTQIGLLQGLAFALFYSVLGIPIARLADRFSRRKIIALGVGFWSFMTAVCGATSNFTHLFLARMGVGVGEAALSPAAQSLITDIVPRRRIGIAQNIYAAAIPIGAGLALIIGGWVAAVVADTDMVVLPLIGEVRGWQAAFIIVALPGIILAPVMMFLPEPERPEKTRSSLASDIKELGPDTWFFVRVALAMACLTGLSYANAAWLPTVLIRVHEMPIKDIGFAYGITFLVFGTLGLICGGLVSDAIAGKRRDAHLLLGVISAFIFILPGVMTPIAPTSTLVIAGISMALVFGGIASGGVAATIQIAAKPHLRATMVAVLLLSQNLIGLTLGPLTVGLLTDYWFGNPDAVGYSLAVVNIFGGLLGAGLLASCLVPYRRILACQ